jgi:hypothetical protein
MGESKRRRTIGEHMELRPGEPIVLKLFTGHDFLDLLLSGAVDVRDEEAQAVRAVAQRATSDSPLHCVICQDVTVFPSRIGFGRSTSKSRVGAVFVVCMPCSVASEDIRQDILEALGEEELKTSDWAS